MTAPEAKAEAARLLVAGVAAHGRNDLAQARQCYEAALQVMPEQADALHLLGVIADQEGRPADAVALIRRAIALSPQAAAFHGNLGTALLGAGDRPAAMTAYRQAVALDPAYVQGYINLGNLLQDDGDPAAALPQYQAAVTLAPADPAARRGMGAALLALKRDEEALEQLATAIRINPDAADLRDLVARALASLGRYADAILHHRKAMTRQPEDLRYRESYASTLLKKDTPGSRSEAERELMAVLAQEPDRLEALVTLGAVLMKQQRPHDARPYLERALAQRPDRLDALVNYSAALSFAGRFTEALATAEQANRLSPDDCIVLAHRGTVHEYAGNYEAALADYAAALQATRRRTPEMLAEVELKLAVLQLSLGRFAEGWPRYRARTDVRLPDPRGTAFRAMLPAWDGEVRAGQRILIWGEQGIGDQIIYAAMLPALQARGADFTFVCDPRLVSLFRRSFPQMQVEAAREGELERFRSQADVQIGLGELGLWLRPSLADFPAPTAYLRADADAVAELRSRYRSHGRKLTVGLIWRSGNVRMGGYKSVPLREWSSVLQRPDILFVDMQYGDTADERRQVQAALGVDILHDDSVDAMNDIDRFAAQCAAVDLVIGVSSSGQHVAAALGRPCWIVLPGGLGRLWYWFLERSDSPWYPQVRLFRQPPGHSEDWAATIAQVGAALDERLQGGAA